MPKIDDLPLVVDHAVRESRSTDGLVGSADFLNPLRLEKLAPLGAALRLEHGTRVLDLGSGLDEVLCSSSFMGLRPATLPAALAVTLFGFGRPRPLGIVQITVWEIHIYGQLMKIPRRARAFFRSWQRARYRAFQSASWASLPVNGLMEPELSCSAIVPRLS